MTQQNNESSGEDEGGPEIAGQVHASTDEVFGDVDTAGNANSRVNNLEEELLQANERVLRAQADLENFRKRTRRDYEEQLKYAQVPLIRDVLSVLDNLRRAITSAGTHENTASLRDGVEMVAKQLESVLVKYNCRPIPSVGEVFDPNYHEAISQMPSETHAAGFVAHEVTTGYQLEDRVIRPSQVIVSTGPAAS